MISRLLLDFTAKLLMIGGVEGTENNSFFKVILCETRSLKLGIQLLKNDLVSLSSNLQSAYFLHLSKHSPLQLDCSHKYYQLLMILCSWSKFSVQLSRKTTKLSSINVCSNFKFI